MAKEPKLKDIKGELLENIDELFTKLDRDRRNALYINEKVKEHLIWTSTAENNTTTTGQYTLKGKLPHIWEAAQSLVAQYKSSLLKAPESLFYANADVGTPQDWCDLQKYYILDILKKGGILNSYASGIDKEIWRGETILFHEWGEKKAKRKIVKEPEVEGEKYSFELEEYTEHEGVSVKVIEPQDFVFDTTKLSPFSTCNYNRDEFNSPDCFKIKRSWMSISAIKSDNLFKDLTSEEENELKTVIYDNRKPSTEQNFDDFSNRFYHRYSNGDMVEILEYWGNFKLQDGTILEDYRIITAGSKVVLRFEPNPYSRCPFVWKPALVDLVTRRGISPLVPAIEYNETATEMYEAGKTQLKFAVNPSYFVEAGNHMDELPEGVEPGQWINISNGLGTDVQFPQEITSYKNAPMGFEFLAEQEKNIQQVTGVNKNMAGQIDNPNMTATQTNQILTGSNLRFSNSLLDFCNLVIIPSLEIVATMTYENTPLGKVDKVKIPDSDGGFNTGEVNDEVRAGKYSYTIGSIQAVMERKAKIPELLPIMQALAPALEKQGTPLDMQKVWNYVAGTFEVGTPSEFIQKNPLNEAISKIPEQNRQQITNALIQLIQNPQLIQKAFQPAPQPIPQPNQMVRDIASKAICDDNTYPESVKMSLLQQGQLQPTQEYIEKISKKMERVNGQPAINGTHQ